MRFAGFVAIALLVLISASGCGDGPQPENGTGRLTPADRAHIAGVFSSYATAQYHDDAGETCSTLSQNGQRFIIGITRGNLGGKVAGLETCTQLLGFVIADDARQFGGDEESAADRATAREARDPSNIRFTSMYGDPIVSLRSGSLIDFRFERENGKWLIAQPGPVGGLR